jgi:hypothetical protein
MLFEVAMNFYELKQAKLSVSGADSPNREMRRQNRGV